MSFRRSGSLLISTGWFDIILELHSIERSDGICAAGDTVSAAVSVTFRAIDIVLGNFEDTDGVIHIAAGILKPYMCTGLNVLKVLIHVLCAGVLVYSDLFAAA